MKEQIAKTWVKLNHPDSPFKEELEKVFIAGMEKSAEILKDTLVNLSKKKI